MSKKPKVFTQNMWGLKAALIVMLAVFAAPVGFAADQGVLGNLLQKVKASAKTTSAPLFDPKTFDAQHPPQVQKANATFQEKIAQKREEFMKKREERRVKFINKLRSKNLSAEEYQAALKKYFDKETSRLQKFQKKQFDQIHKHAGKGTS